METDMDMYDMYTTSQIARSLGITAGRLRQWVHQGRISPSRSAQGLVNFWDRSKVDEIKALMADLKKCGRKPAKTP